MYYHYISGSLFHETDKRIRISIKMKWIHNTAKVNGVKASCLNNNCYIMSIRIEKYELLQLTIFDDEK